MMNAEISEIKEDKTDSKENNTSFGTKEILAVINNDQGGSKKDEILKDQNDEIDKEETQQCSLEYSDKGKQKTDEILNDHKDEIEMEENQPCSLEYSNKKLRINDEFLNEQNDEIDTKQTQPCSLENSDKKTQIYELNEIDFEKEVNKKLNFNNGNNSNEHENQHIVMINRDQLLKFIYLLPLILMITLALFHPEFKVNTNLLSHKYNACPYTYKTSNSNNSLYDLLNSQSKNYFNYMKEFVNSSTLFEVIITNQKHLEKILEGKDIFNYLDFDHFKEYKKIIKTSREFSHSIILLSQKFDNELYQTLNDMIQEHFEKNNFRHISNILKDIKKSFLSISKQLEKVELVKTKYVNDIQNNLRFENALKIHLKENIILLTLFLFVGMYLTIFLNKIDMLKGIYGLMILLVVMLIIVNQNYSKVREKIHEISMGIDNNQKMLLSLKETYFKMNCELTNYLDISINFSNIIDKKNEEIKLLLTKIISEVKEFSQLEIEETIKFAENDEVNFDLLIPKNLVSKELNDSINDVKTNLTEIRKETCRYFSNLHLFSESFMKNIDIIRTDIMDNNGFKFKQFFSYITSFFKKKTKYSKQLIHSLKKNVNKIDVVKFDLKKEEIDHCDQQNLYVKVTNGVGVTLGSVIGYTGSTLAVASGTIPVIGIAAGTAALGYYISENYLTKYFKEKMKEINNRFKNFRRFLNIKKVNLDDNYIKISKIKENLNQLISLIENIYEELKNKFGNDENKLTQYLMNEDKSYINKLLELVRDKIFTTWKMSKDNNLNQFGLK